MKVSTYSRNAVNCIIDVALHQGKLVSLSSVAQRQQVSTAFLEQIFAKLRRAGLVEATRGPGGGYRLAKALHEISIADILYAMEDTIDITGCKGGRNCRSGTQCLSHELWDQLHLYMHSYFSDITLEHMVFQIQGKEAVSPSPFVVPEAQATYIQPKGALR